MANTDYKLIKEFTWNDKTKNPQEEFNLMETIGKG